METNRFRKLIKYLSYLLLEGGLYGFLMYFVYNWLSGYSLLFAYLGNLVLIIIALVSDELTFKVYDTALQSEETLAQLKKSKFFHYFLDAYISFKAMLYTFYILIMIFSQIIHAFPGFVPINLRNFIFANEYSILLLLAIDLLTGQFIKDRLRIKKLSDKYENLLAETKDKETINDFNQVR